MCPLFPGWLYLFWKLLFTFLVSILSLPSDVSSLFVFTYLFYGSLCAHEPTTFLFLLPLWSFCCSWRAFSQRTEKIYRPPWQILFCGMCVLRNSYPVERYLIISVHKHWIQNKTQNNSWHMRSVYLSTLYLFFESIRTLLFVQQNKN